METPTVIISIHNKNVSLRFGKMSSQILQDEIRKGRKLKDGEHLNDLGICYVLWSGYLDFQKHCKRLPMLDFEDFYNIVEESPEDVTRALKVWMSSPVIVAALDQHYQKN